MSDNTVMIGDWSCADGPVVEADAFGCVWTLTGLGGWFGGLAVRAAPIDRLASDGTDDGPITFDARTVTLEGTVWAPDRASLQIALDRVSAVLSGPSRMGLMIVIEDVAFISRQLLVRLGGPTLIQRTGSQSATFSLSLYAPDPARMSLNEWTIGSARYTPGGFVTIPLDVPVVFGPPGGTGFLRLWNDGTTVAWPLISFTGPLVNPSLSVIGGAGKVAAVINLTAADVLTVDTRRRTVLLGDASRRAVMTYDTVWFSLPPGETVLYFSAESGAGEVSVSWRDTWA